MSKSIFAKPGALIPLAMSLAALSVVLVHIAFFGAVREADEGAAAHLWQIFMVAQLPVMTFFAIKWLPRVPRQAVGVLGLQAAGFFAALAPVFILGL